MSNKNKISLVILLFVLLPWSIYGCAMDSVEGNICLIKKEAIKNDVNVDRALAIAKCESHLRHFNEKTGGVLRGTVNPKDVGLFMINEKYHLDTSKKLGYDIHDKVDNIKYAIYLMKTKGFSPWNWSKECQKNERGKL